jgi:hypothetical protein
LAKDAKNAQNEMIGVEQLPDQSIEVDLTEPQQIQESTIGVLMLSLFQIADQAKILHLQTDFDTEHRHFGLFYDTFIGQVDTLIEAIAGKYGKDKLKFNQASIMVYDYELAKPLFFEMVDEILKTNFYALFDREKDSELYNLVDEIISLKNKIQYLLQMK